MQCVTNDTNITSTGHSRNHPPTPSTFFTGVALISRVAYDPAGRVRTPGPPGKLRPWTQSSG